MGRTIDVCLSPDLMHLYPVKEYAVVVVDVLRATSCMTTAFAHGVKTIRPLAKLEECLALKSLDCFTSGERDGKKVDGFDMGNSPFEYMSPAIRGKNIAFTTTNGTQAIVKSIGARAIIIGSFLNLTAVARHMETLGENVLVVCSGWKGRFNLEDTLFAGALVEKLKDTHEPACDAPIAARRLYNEAKSDMVAYLRDSSHVRRLARLNIHRDIEFCLTPDQYHVVPVLADGVLTV
jgi:2-phosphosulfolactate phosphatase